MSRLGFLLLLTAALLLAQTSATPKHHPTFSTDGNWVNQQDSLQNRAREILKAELSRKLDPACDSAKLSNVEFKNCFGADAAITQRNYRAFVQAFEAYLAIEPPDIPVKGLPLPSKNFAEGEAAWRSYLDKICEALGDTDEGGSGTGADETNCRRKLTRQHMRDLNSVFFERGYPDLR